MFSFSFPFWRLVFCYLHSVSLLSGEDDSCCEVCHYRKRELSREKTRVNRARSRSRERTPRGYASCSDTSTGVSEESRSRADTSSEDASSLSCQPEERGRPSLRRDVTQSTVEIIEEKENLKENDSKLANVKKSFSLFKIFQKSRAKERKVGRQCPVCGNEESESCCISKRTPVQEPWFDNNLRKQRQPKPGTKGRKQKIDNEDFINAWRNNDGSVSSCELYYTRSQSDYESRSRRPNNRNVSFESDSECMVRHRRIQRTKSGSELCMLGRNNNNPDSLKRRLLSRSCERLTTTSTDSQETKRDFGQQFVQNRPAEEQTVSDKLQRRYRKKNRRSKSCEKLNALNSPQKKSYRNYDSDWEIRSTVETSVVSQSASLKQRQKARSCERLSERQPETDDEVRLIERKAKRKNLEQKLGSKVIGNLELSGNNGNAMLITGIPSKPVIKEATVRKTKITKSPQNPSEKVHYSKKSTSLPRQRRVTSDTDEVWVKARYDNKPCHECNFNQNDNYSDNNSARKSQTLGRRLPPRTDQYRDTAPSFILCKDNQKQRTYGQEDVILRLQSSDDAVCYSEQLRLVASNQREKLFSSTHDCRIGHEKIPSVNGCKTSQGSNRSRTRSGKNPDPLLTEDAFGYEMRDPHSAYIKFPQSNSKSVLETNIDEHSSLGRHKYTSLTSLSTTMSTTSEDSLDSGNGSLSDRTLKQEENANSYSPIDAERQRQLTSAPRQMTTRPLVRGCGPVHETSDYESEASLSDANLHARPIGRRQLPKLDQNFNVQPTSLASSHRRPRIRYVEY